MTLSNPYKFDGKEFDTEIGLAYYGARYYSPELGVWYGCDPLMEKYSASSPYVFCAFLPKEEKVSNKNQRIFRDVYLDKVVDESINQMIKNE